MKKFIFILASLVFSFSIAHAGGVTDDNNGNKGYILVSTGENNGSNSVGHWTDSSFLKGEKGDTGAQGIQGVKGDTGATGLQGIQGVAGRDGIDGINGTNGRDGVDGLNGTNGVDGKVGPQGPTGPKGSQGKKGDVGPQGIAGVNGQDGVNGSDGINGVDGTNGTDGINGQDGAIGPTGENGKDGIDGSNGENGEQGVKGDQGVKGNTGDTGAKGVDVDPAKVKAQDDKINELNNKVHELEEPKAILGLAVRVYDSKKWTVTTFVDYATERANVDRYGVRATYKMGRSYEEKRLDELEAKINHMTSFEQGSAEVPSGEYYTQGSAIGYRQSF